MMLNYQTKYGCKWTSSLKKLSKKSHMLIVSPHCDLDTEELIFLHDIQPHDKQYTTIPHLVKNG